MSLAINGPFCDFRMKLNSSNLVGSRFTTCGSFAGLLNSGISLALNATGKLCRSFVAERWGKLGMSKGFALKIELRSDEANVDWSYRRLFSGKALNLGCF